MQKAPALTDQNRQEILEKVLATIRTKFYKPEMLDAAWEWAVETHRPKIEQSCSPQAFEDAVSELLRQLKVSHFGFFHGSAKRASSRAALSATYLERETEHGRRWVFQDVHSGGAAATAGIVPGDLLHSVNRKQIVPPEHPVFPMGSTSAMEIENASGTIQTVPVFRSVLRRVRQEREASECLLEGRPSPQECERTGCPKRSGVENVAGTSA